MSTEDEYAEIEALASHPETDWDVLHWIAENYPELRPAVAANPGTYQELIDALASLGDPQIDVAIASRHPGRDVSSAQASTNPLAGMYDTETQQAIPAYQEEPASELPPEPELDHAPAPEAEPEPGVGPGSEEPAPEFFEDPAASAATPQTPPAKAPEAADAPEHQGFTAADSPLRLRPDDHYEPPRDPYAAEPGLSTGEHPSVLAPAGPVGYRESTGEENSETEPAGGSRGNALMYTGLVLIAVGVLTGVMFLAGMFFGGEDDPVAEPEPTEGPFTQAPAEEEDEDTTEEEAAEGPDEDALAQARAALAALPEESSCEATDDAGVLAEFLSAGADDENFPAEEHTSELEEALAGLQDTCDAEHAGEVVSEVRAGTEAGNAPEVLAGLDYDWVDRGLADRGAEVVTGFAAHDGNIECVFDDGVRCTVYDHNFSAPDGCEDGTTYQLQVTGASLACEATVEPEGREEFSADDLATDGFLECAVLDDRVSCYSALNPGLGFEVSETGHYTYGG